MHEESLPKLEVLFTAGDRLPTLAGVIENTDLTGHTVRLNLARPSAALQKDATITDASAGAFEFAWIAGDIEEGIGQQALLRLITPGGLSLTLGRFVIDVLGVPAP